MPVGYESQYPYSRDGRMPGNNEKIPIPDPIVPLAYAAAITKQIKLGTGILILPQRHPVYVAKEMATLDVLSKGRALLGIGIGWLEEEFNVVGVPFRERAARTEESVRALRSLWGAEPSQFDGRFYRWGPVESYPKPVQPGGVPVIVGGHVEGAARRAARIGDGFFPARGELDLLAQLFTALRDECGKVGRKPEEIELTTGMAGHGSRQRAPLRGPRRLAPHRAAARLRRGRSAPRSRSLRERIDPIAPGGSAIPATVMPAASGPSQSPQATARVVRAREDRHATRPAPCARARRRRATSSPDGRITAEMPVLVTRSCGAPRLEAAEGRHGEVQARPAALREPGVVRERDDQLGAGARRLAREPRRRWRRSRSSGATRIVAAVGEAQRQHARAARRRASGRARAGARAARASRARRARARSAGTAHALR